MKLPLNKNGEPSSAIGTKFSCNALKSKTKNELIGYLNIAQYNYERVNERLFNLSKYAVKLDEALDKACEWIDKFGCCPYFVFDKDISCQESCTNDAKKMLERVFDERRQRMNYMSEIAKMLGVEFDEEFKVEGYIFKYKFTEKGFYPVEKDYISYTVLYELLSGKRSLIKLPKSILDDVERKYLAKVIKPYRHRIKYFYKYAYGAKDDSEAIAAAIKDGSYLLLPSFEKDTMYKNMKLMKTYTLEELGL